MAMLQLDQSRIKQKIKLNIVHLFCVQQRFSWSRYIDSLSIWMHEP